MTSPAGPSPENLTALLASLYDSTGAPSPNLKRAQAHFRDRFREVAQRLGGFLLSAKVEARTEISPEGCRLLLRGELMSLPPRDALRRLLPRLISPSTAGAGFGLRPDDGELLTQEGPGWGAVLTSTEQGGVGAVLERGVLTAAMVWHHPEDDVAQAARTPSAASGPLGDLSQALRATAGGVDLDWDPLSGGHLLISRRGGWQWDVRSGEVWGEGLSLRGEAAAEALLSAARARAASAEGLMSLAARMGGKTYRYRPIGLDTLHLTELIVNRAQEWASSQIKEVLSKVGPWAVKPKVTGRCLGSRASCAAYFRDPVDVARMGPFLWLTVNVIETREGIGLKAAYVTAGGEEVVFGPEDDLVVDPTNAAQVMKALDLLRPGLERACQARRS